jgi:WD40-like Beta Propeller Repeat
MRPASEPSRVRASRAFAALVVGALVWPGLSCAKVRQQMDGGAGMGGGAGPAGATGTAGEVATGGVGGAGGGGGIGYAPPCTSACTDFPVAPFLDPGVPADAPTMFAGAPTGVGPCITEPEDGALFPKNWLRPRVKFQPAVAGTLHEIRFHADKEANDVVAYTTRDTWTLPKPIWSDLAAHVQDAPITVTVRALGGGATAVKFTVAPVGAEGSIVYWAADPAELGTQTAAKFSTLQGFAVGDESTITALTVADVQMLTRGANNAPRAVTCIGCHSSTPDGESVAFVDNYPWSMGIAGVKPQRTGKEPSVQYGGYLTPGGEEAIRQPGLGIFSFSRSHWTKGDRIIVAPYYLDKACGRYDQNNPTPRLAWLDAEAPDITGACPVEGTTFGFITRNGDGKGAANPTWSPDGMTIVYSSTNGNQDGRLSKGPTDLFQVPYNDKMGGDATPLPGGSDPAFEEYYPAFSSDGKLVVFDRIPQGGVMYANPQAELFVVRADGSTPTPLRLRANDPPKCGGLVSPGVNNHWAKWAPGLKAPAGMMLPSATPDGAPPNANGKDYYWLIFSSNRYGTPPVTAGGITVQVSQLYATALVVDETGIELYPAIYLWNQHTDKLNTTPAWDAFQIPIIP